MMIVDWVRACARPQTAFGGQPHAIPGAIEAEDFDDGVLRQAYLDCDAGNTGGAYRPDSDVDLEPCSEGGFNVGWFCGSEWLEYTTRAARPGRYAVDLRVASPSGGRLRIEVDGEDLTGEVAVPPTGGWQVWRTISTTIDLDDVDSIIRLVNAGDDTERFNLNRMDFRPAGPIANSPR